MTRKSISAVFGWLSLLTLLLAVDGSTWAGQAPAAAPRLEVVDHLKIGGDGGWDFLAVDAKRHHLFVTRRDALQVVDTETGKLVATLSPLAGTHGIAFANELGFITNGKSNAVTIVDLNTLRIIDTVSIPGVGPDAILFEPTNNRIYTMNHRSGNITVLDASTRKVIGTIDALPALEAAVTNGKGRIYVNSEDANEVAVVDGASLKMVAHWPLGECKRPTGLAIDVPHARLFSVCANNKMIVMDATSGRLVAEEPIGGRPDGAAFDPELGLAYSSNGDGSLTVVREDDPEHLRVVGTVPTQLGARTVALDPQMHRLYLPAASYGPPPPATEQTPRPRPAIIPGTFDILVVAPNAGR